MPHIPLNLNPHTDLELFQMFNLEIEGANEQLWYFTPKQRGGVVQNFDAEKAHHERTKEEQASAVSDLADYYQEQMERHGDKFAVLPCGEEESYFGPEHQEVPE